MMTNDQFVLVAYAITAIAVLALVSWIFLDQRARRREMAELDAIGIRRRSARGKKAEAPR